MGTKQSRQNASDGPSNTEDQHTNAGPIFRDTGRPLYFHEGVYGKHIELTNNNTNAKRETRHDFGITFSSEQIHVNELASFEIVDCDNSSSWMGDLRFGVTTIDPLQMFQDLNKKLPPNAIPYLVKMDRFWAKVLSEDLQNLEKSSKISFFIDENGYLKGRVNDNEFKELFSELPTTDPFWMMLDIYGNTTAVQLLDVRPILNQPQEEDRRDRLQPEESTSGTTHLPDVALQFHPDDYASSDSEALQHVLSKPEPALLLLYYSLVYPHLMYALLVVADFVNLFLLVAIGLLVDNNPLSKDQNARPGSSFSILDASANFHPDDYAISDSEALQRVLSNPDASPQFNPGDYASSDAEALDRVLSKPGASLDVFPQFDRGDYALSDSQALDLVLSKTESSRPKPREFRLLIRDDDNDSRSSESDDDLGIDKKWKEQLKIGESENSSHQRKEEAKQVIIEMQEIEIPKQLQPYKGVCKKLEETYRKSLRLLDCNCTFSSTCGEGVEFVEPYRNRIRVKHHDIQNGSCLAFSGTPLVPGNTIYFKVFQTSDTRHTLKFGVTSCDPAKLDVSQLPSDSYELEERDEEYWVTETIDSQLSDGDLVSISYGFAGFLNYDFNYCHSQSLCQCDTLQTLWLFIDLSGNVGDLLMIAMENPPTK